MISRRQAGPGPAEGCGATVGCTDDGTGADDRAAHPAAPPAGLDAGRLRAVRAREPCRGSPGSTARSGSWPSCSAWPSSAPPSCSRGRPRWPSSTCRPAWPSPLLAFVAVLPEYAVDFVFAWKGGQRGRAVRARVPGRRRPPATPPCSLALANMTGANRLLIGVGWALVVLLAWRRTGGRRRGRRGRSTEVAPRPDPLGGAGVPDRRQRLLADPAAEAPHHAARRRRARRRCSSPTRSAISRAPAEEPAPGRAGALRSATFAERNRRLTVALLFVFAAGGDPALRRALRRRPWSTRARRFGVSAFLLVQWLAPLASEAPELLVAGLFAWRLQHRTAGSGTLVSSKVNQWTLLVGTLPIVFAIAAGSLHGLPLAGPPAEELFLTAAQSVFAVAILANRRISVKEACIAVRPVLRPVRGRGRAARRRARVERSASASSTSCWPPDPPPPPPGHAGPAARRPAHRYARWPARMTACTAGGVRATADAPLPPSTGPGPSTGWPRRRFDVLRRRRRDHRRRRGPRRRRPGPADRPGGAGRLRLGHVVEVVEAGARRACATCARGEYRLVHEALAERQRLLATPPTWSSRCPS